MQKNKSRNPGRNFVCNIRCQVDQNGEVSDMIAKDTEVGTPGQADFLIGFYISFILIYQPQLILPLR